MWTGVSISSSEGRLASWADMGTDTPPRAQVLPKGHPPSLSPPPLPPSFSFSSSSSLSHLPFCPPLFSALFLCPCLSLSLSLPFSLSLSFFPLFPPRFSLSPLFWFYLLSSSFTVKDNTPISTHLRPPPTHPLDFTSVLLVIPAGGNNPVTLRQSK